MNDQPVVVTSQQKAAAAIVTKCIEFGGKLEWLPRRVAPKNLLKRCAAVCEVEDDDDFIVPARRAAGAREPYYTPEALEWVRKCLDT